MECSNISRVSSNGKQILEEQKNISHTVAMNLTRSNVHAYVLRVVAFGVHHHNGSKVDIKLIRIHDSVCIRC